MTAPLYDLVHSIALDIVNASSEEDETALEESYKVLKDLCESNEGSKYDHPLQWEALGDFSENVETAEKFYRKGLALAEKLNLPEYIASINFALAESYYEQGNEHEAYNLACKAKESSHGITDKALSAAINEFYLNFGKEL